MPTCLVCSLALSQNAGFIPRRQITGALSHLQILCNGANSSSRPSSNKIWNRSSSTNIRDGTSGAHLSAISRVVVAPRHEVLTLVRQTKALLPRVLVAKGLRPDQASESLEFWNEVLVETPDFIPSAEAARIVVYGVGEWSGAQNLVTALLEEPFSSDNAQNEVVRSRWKGHTEQDSLTIEYEGAVKGNTTFAVPSSYLRRFPLPVQITELGSSSSQFPILSERDAAALFQSDIPILVVNPIVTPIPTLLNVMLPTSNPNLIIIITSTSPVPEISNHIQSYLGVSRVLLIDPSLALGALDILNSDSRSALAVQRYQDDFVGSRISTLTDTLGDILSAKVDAEPAPVAFRINTVLAHIRGALDACAANLKHAKNEINTVLAEVSKLEKDMEKFRVTVHGDVFGVESGNKTEVAVDDGEVGRALKTSEKEIRTAMDSMTWWKLLWRVDEVFQLVGGTTQRVWCRGLEKMLIFQSGRLEAAQKSYEAAAFALLSSLPPSPSPFHSPVLFNALQRTISSPSYSMAPTSLIAPINARRTKLVQFPTTRLHIASQKAVFGMYGGLATGFGVWWTAWVGWLAGTGDGLFGSLGLDGTTTMGAAVFGALAAVRWAAGHWERAKKKWWQDSERLGEGLNRDLKFTLDRVVKNNVLVVAEKAVSGLLILAEKRKAEVAEIEDELEKLNIALCRVEERLNTQK